MGLTVLVLATFAACLRFGGSQGDPLPLSLVELVTGTPIDSFEDLQRLLDSDSVEKDPDGPLVQKLLPNHTAPHRLPRSLGDIQVAQQAQCKVRTEVMEVSRSMLDRRNANFLLWPPCVEVQRCSGCCNTRNLQCVATVSRIHPLQVMKIQFVNKQPVYEKAVISVEDHVECRCKSAVSANMPRTTARKPQSPPPPPKAPRLKNLSKEDIYQHDVLKQNQNFQLEELEGHQWQTQTPDTRSGTSSQGEPLIPSGEQASLGAATQQGAEEKEVQWEEDIHLGNERPPERPGYRHTGTRLDAGQGLSHHSKATEEKLRSEALTPDSGSTATRRPEAVEPRPSLRPNAVTRHPHAHRPGFAHAGTTNQRPLSEEHQRDNKQLGVEMWSSYPVKQEEFEASKKQGLSDQARDQLQEQQTRQQNHHRQQHHHQPHQQAHMTTNAAMAPPTTRSPVVMQTPSPFRPPRRRSSTLRRRLRKNRNRISKTAMRAILM